MNADTQTRRLAEAISVAETHEQRRPFDYHYPTVEELRPFLGRNWVIARRSPRIVAHYGEDVNCLSPQAHDKAEQQAIEARGYARPAEKVIADLIALVANLAAAKSIGCGTSAEFMENSPTIQAARAVLAKARQP